MVSQGSYVKTMKLKTSILLLAITAFAAGSSAFAQLVYTNEGSTSWGNAIRASAHDQAIFNTLGSQSSFTLDSIASAGTFSDITGTLLSNEFAVGSNGSFPTFVEVSFAFRSAIDSDQLLSLGSPSTVLYDSTAPASLLNSIRIDGTGSFANTANWINFQYSDLSVGTSATMFETGFKVYEAVDDPNYNYYVFGDEDRKTFDEDFNDFDFVVRINKTAVGFQPVPEPSTYGLMGGAVLLGLVALRRRKRLAA